MGMVTFVQIEAEDALAPFLAGPASGLRYRNGQWVKFAVPDVPAAHHARDGRVVGIYVKAGVDATGEWAPERIMVVGPMGTNLMIVGGDGTPMSLAINPGMCVDLAAVTSRDDIPAPRLATMDPTWEPRP
jgi:hypothetical protein